MPIVERGKMKHCFLFLLSIFILIVIPSCASQQKKVETMPGINISEDDFNKNIRISLHPGTTNYVKNNDVGIFILNNRSKDSIVFKEQTGIKIFEKQKEGWIEIENRFRYPEEEYILNPPTKNLNSLVFVTQPFDPDLKNSAVIRIVIVGYVQDKPKEMVGSYIDMEIIP